MDKIYISLYLIWTRKKMAEKEVIQEDVVQDAPEASEDFDSEELFDGLTAVED